MLARVRTTVAKRFTDRIAVHDSSPWKPRPRATRRVLAEAGTATSTATASSRRPPAMPQLRSTWPSPSIAPAALAAAEVALPPCRSRKRQDNPDALHMLAMVRLASGAPRDALPLIVRALDATEWRDGRHANKSRARACGARESACAPRARRAARAQRIAQRHAAGERRGAVVQPCQVRGTRACARCARRTTATSSSSSSTTARRTIRCARSSARFATCRFQRSSLRARIAARTPR